MRALILITILQFLMSQSCDTGKKERTAQAWLNDKYIECLRNNLPCECEKQTGTYYSLVLETDTVSKNYGITLSNYEAMEPNPYSINKIASNEYEVLTNGLNSTSWAKVLLNREQLLFVVGKSAFKFSKSRVAEGYDVDHYFEDNVQLLNDAFVAKGYPNLEKIVNETNLRCDCNKWMAGQNLLSVKGATKSWILEIKNDSLHILKITNEDKDPDDPVQTKKVAAFKWN